MCLTTFQNEPYIAEKDIIIYKALFKSGKQIISPFQEFSYILNKLYQTDFRITLGLSNISVKNIYEGFHGYRYKKYATSKWIEVYKCVIPKGSHYYISINQKEIVSNQIIIKRKLWFNRF